MSVNVEQEISRIKNSIIKADKFIAEQNKRFCNKRMEIKQQLTNKNLDKFNREFLLVLHEAYNI